MGVTTKRRGKALRFGCGVQSPLSFYKRFLLKTFEVCPKLLRFEVISSIWSSKLDGSRQQTWKKSANECSPGPCSASNRFREILPTYTYARMHTCQRQILFDLSTNTVFPWRSAYSAQAINFVACVHGRSVLEILKITVRHRSLWWLIRHHHRHTCARNSEKVRFAQSLP